MNADQAKKWAIKYHDPDKDRYSIFDEWDNIKDPLKKKQSKKEMLENPKLKKIFQWGGEEGLNPSYNNFKIAIKDGNLYMVKYFIARGYEPNEWDIYNAIIKGKIDIVKHLIKGVSPHQVAKCGDIDSLKYLVDNVKFIPNQVTLNVAIRSEKLNIIKYLVEERGLFPNFQNFHDAATHETPEIRKYFENLAENGAHHVKVYTSYYGAPAA